MRSIEGRDLYLTKIISCIGERVASSTDGINWRFQEVLLALHVTNAGKFRLNVIFGLPFIEEETNKLLRRSNVFRFSLSTLANTQ